MHFGKEGPVFGISCLIFCAVWKRSGFRYFESKFLSSLENEVHVSAFHVRVSVQCGKRGLGFGISCLSFCAVWKTRSGFPHFMSEFGKRDPGLENSSEPTVWAFRVLSFCAV